MSHQPRCKDCRVLGEILHPRSLLCTKCERKARGLPAVPKCIHCAKDCTPDEGIVCEECYAKYTPGMLADLDQ